MRRRPSRKAVRDTIGQVALSSPVGFNAIRMVGALNTVADLGSLQSMPVQMVLDAMGVTTAAELLAVLRGTAGMAAVAALSYAGAGDVTGDEVLGATVIVVDDTVTFPASLLP